MSESQVAIKTAGGAVYAPSWEAIAKLNDRLATLLSSVGMVEKDGRNPHFKYEYQSYDAVALAVRSALSAVGLSFTVGIVPSENGTGGNKRLVNIEATFGDPATGAMRMLYWQGEGQDTQDKGTAKALTSAVKYMLMRNLLVTSTEDEDPDGDGPPPRQATMANRPKPATTTKSAPATANEETWDYGAWWARAGRLRVDKDTVHAGFGIESMKDYAGTKDHAKAVLDVLAYGVHKTLTVKNMETALECKPVALWQGTLDEARAAMQVWIANQEGERLAEEDGEIEF